MKSHGRGTLTAEIPNSNANHQNHKTMNSAALLPLILRMESANRFQREELKKLRRELEADAKAMTRELLPILNPKLKSTKKK